MDILEDFQKHLKKWCKDNHKPLPPEGKINKYWQLAWEDYMKTTLTDNWESRKNEFLNISLLTKQEQKLQEKQNKLDTRYEETEEVVETEEQSSSWDRIQKFLN